MSEKHVEDFGALIKQVEEESKRSKVTRKKTSKERLAEYNRLMTKRKRQKSIHDLIIDLVIVLSFIMIAYSTFGK